MLALPVVTAQAGFLPSTGFLFITWIMMTLGAFLILEVNLWLPEGSNLITMAKQTLGPAGAWLTWLIYLALLYCLLCAYLAGGGDLVHGLFGFMHVHLPVALGIILFLVIFGGIVCLGIQSVDWVNRGIMLVKLASYFFVLVVALAFMHPVRLTVGEWKPLLPTMTTMITSFGFAIIVPSLRSYFHNDAKKLRLALLIGSLIPLVFYILWEAAIFGALPRGGQGGLLHLVHAPTPITALMKSLSHIAHHDVVLVASRLFTSVCVLTAFLGVSLCMTDFLADGVGVKKQGLPGWGINAATFLPPLVLVLFIPKLFLFGISFAGIFCILLLILLPALMAWRGQKRLAISKQKNTWLTHKSIMSVLILLSIVLLVWGVWLL